ncbi:MAG: hypothetical protein RSL74_00685 [Clostridium sp.]
MEKEKQTDRRAEINTGNPEGKSRKYVDFKRMLIYNNSLANQ